MRPLLAYTNPQVETIVGRDVHLQCLVLLGNPRPTISWVKMGERVQSRGRIVDDGNGNLVIKNVKVVDEGEYTCVASNVGGNATYVTNLDVQGREPDHFIFELSFSGEFYRIRMTLFYDLWDVAFYPLNANYMSTCIWIISGSRIDKT